MRLMRLLDELDPSTQVLLPFRLRHLGKVGLEVLDLWVDEQAPELGDSLAREQPAGELGPETKSPAQLLPFLRAKKSLLVEPLW